MANVGSKNRYMFVISTTAGWHTVGQRIADHLTSIQQAGHRFVAYKSNGFAKRFTHQKNYHDVPLHIPLFDAFTVNFWQAAGLRREARRYDAVIAGHITQAAAMLDRRGPPVIAYVDMTRHLHRLAFDDRGISDAAIERERDVLHRLAHVITMSEWAADDIVSYYNVPRAKVTVIPPPAQNGIVRPKSEGRRPTEKSRLKALFVGSDFVRKGGDRLIDWQRSRLHHCVDLFIVTGRRFEDHSVPNTEWLGSVSNALLTSAIMPDMDLLCVPTRKDGSAVVLVEAAMAGIPAVAHAIGGVAELIEDGVTGHVVDPASGHSFISRIEELHDDRQRLARFGASAREKALREFAPGVVFDRIVACADKVVAATN